jgi:hypothetical protein
VALTEYQRVLMNNTEIALIAAEQIKRYSEAVEQDSIALLWTFVHGFLVTVGNIAKLLYPERFHTKTGKHALTLFARERGVQLRESLSITNQDPLFQVIKSNKARNYFEHFDDWLDTWASISKTRAVADFNPWGRSPNLSAIGDNVTLFRNFDVENFSIIYGRDVYQLKPVIDAIRELHLRVRKAWFSNLGVEPFPTPRSNPSS